MRRNTILAIDIRTKRQLESWARASVHLQEKHCHVRVIEKSLEEKTLKGEEGQRMISRVNRHQKGVDMNKTEDIGDNEIFECAKLKFSHFFRRKKIPNKSQFVYLGTCAAQN